MEGGDAVNDFTSEVRALPGSKAGGGHVIKPTMPARWPVRVVPSGPDPTRDRHPIQASFAVPRPPGGRSRSFWPQPSNATPMICARGSPHWRSRLPGQGSEPQSWPSRCCLSSRAISPCACARAAPPTPRLPGGSPRPSWSAQLQSERRWVGTLSCDGRDARPNVCSADLWPGWNYRQAVNLQRPRVVPSLREMWPGGQPPESLGRLQNSCPRCGLTHSVAALVEKSGPSHRDFECPNTSKSPLISIFWNGHGWTWRMDPVWALGLQLPPE
jgi:hypothetical protein